MTVSFFLNNTCHIRLFSIASLPSLFFKYISKKNIFFIVLIAHLNCLYIHVFATKLLWNLVFVPLFAILSLNLDNLHFSKLKSGIPGEIN